MPDDRIIATLGEASVYVRPLKDAGRYACEIVKTAGYGYDEQRIFLVDDEVESLIEALQRSRE